MKMEQGMASDGLIEKRIINGLAKILNKSQRKRGLSKSST